MGLWCNRGRQLLRQAWAVKSGIEMALARSELPLSVFEAVSDTPEEAEEMQYQDKKARRRASAAASQGFR